MDWRRTTHQLDEQQMEFINNVLQTAPKRYWISGVAGTGKSLVLLRLAERLKKLPDSPVVIIATFTNALTKMFEFHANLQGIRVMNIYALERQKPQCDYLLIDEFQDVARSTFDSFLQLARRGVFVGGDLDQQIYAELIENAGNQTMDQAFVMSSAFLNRTFTRAYRISRTGVRVSETILGKKFNDIQYESSQDCKYRYTVATGPTTHYKLIDEYVTDRQETGSPVGVLFTKNDDITDYLKFVSPKISVNGKISRDAPQINKQLRELGSKYRTLGNDESLVDEAAKQPLTILSTIHSAKGLDFDYVAVASLPKKPNKELVYVACSRAKRMTYVISQSPVPLFESGTMRELLTVIDDDF